MTKIISIANQKGGVGKTTTCVNLGTALSLMGNKVLLIDLDPQANLSTYLKYEETDYSTTMSDIIEKEAGFKGGVSKDCIQTSVKNRVDFIPSDIGLSEADYYMIPSIQREHILQRVLKNPIFEDYDYILIDCVPSLGLLVMNALVASDGIIVPVQTQKFALNGLQGLIQMKDLVANLNPKLDIIGILATMTENTNMSRSSLAELQEKYAELLFETTISKAVEAAYSSEAGTSLCLNQGSKLGQEYISLAGELVKRMEG